MLFRLDFQSAVPIYRQIRDQVVLAVAQGELTPGGCPPPGHWRRTRVSM